MWSIAGCTSLATDYRKEGFRMLEAGFASLAETPDLHHVIKLKDVTIHIVGRRSLFGDGKAAAYGSPVAAYANTNNEIWLFGKEVDGKIILNQAILGHELYHLMEFSSKELANPDKLDEMGL